MLSTNSCVLLGLPVLSLHSSNPPSPPFRLNWKTENAKAFVSHEAINTAKSTVTYYHHPRYLSFSNQWVWSAEIVARGCAKVRINLCTVYRGVIPGGGWGGLWPPNFRPTTLFSGFTHTTDRKIPSEVVLMGSFMSVIYGNIR